MQSLHFSTVSDTRWLWSHNTQMAVFSILTSFSAKTKGYINKPLLAVLRNLGLNEILLKICFLQGSGWKAFKNNNTNFESA